MERLEFDNSGLRADYRGMATSNPTTVRSRALGALAVLVLALLISLMLFVGRAGCTSAVAFDRPTEDAAQPTDFGAALASGTNGSADVDATIADPRAKRDAAALAVGPVRGLVVDARTREIVPHVEVVLTLGPRTERILVGDDGRFASADEFPSGEIHAVVHDDGAVVGEARIEHDAMAGTNERRIEVSIGPTIPVASVDKVAVRVEAWRARIVESALFPEIVAELEVVESGLAVRTPSTARPDREWSWKSIRPGNPPWIRYPRHEHEPNSSVRSLLELRDDSANRKGSFILKSTVGVHPPVDVETLAFAKARLRLVRAPANEKLPMRVVVYDTRDDPLPGAPTAPVFDEGVVDDKGEIEFTDLDGGTKHVVGWSREERVDQHLVVPAGPLDFFDVPTKRAERGARTWVKNRGLPWYMADLIHVVAKPAVAAGRMRGWMTSIDRGGSFQGEAVYAGIDAHVVLGEMSQRTFGGRLRDVFTVYRFDVDKHADAEICFGPTGSFFPAKSRGARDPLVLFEALQFSWSAWSEGKQPVFGTTQDFGEAADDTRAVKFDFEPGWGAHIVLRAGSPSDIRSDLALWTDEKMRNRSRSEDRDGPRVEAAVLAAPPVVGVTLQIDGYDEAVSDEAGEIRLRRAFEPRQLTLVGRGWRLTAFEHLPGKAPRYVAWLKRNP